MLIVATVATILAPSGTACAQGTTFIYTGQLSDEHGPANGTYDLTFTLYGTSTGGSAIAGPETNAATLVSNGEYAALLDFGAALDGSPRWFRNRRPDQWWHVGFITLSPRQPLLAVPYAIVADSASNLLGSLPATQLSGTVPLAQLPAAILTNNASGISLDGYFNGYYSGDGHSLSNLNPQSLSSGSVTAPIQFMNEGNYFQGLFSGYHSGDGRYLTNLNPQNLSSGSVTAPIQSGERGQLLSRLV